MTQWLLYGAYGYTGQLLIEEAMKRGHKPVLAGRDAQKLITLGQKYDLPSLAFGLDETDRLRKIVADFDLVFHAAGPFIYTSEPMIQACLAGQTHYLDITGELPVFETTFSYNDHALEQGIALVSGAGFDVVPTDCLAAYVAQKMPDATRLEIAISSNTQASSGTVNSLLEMIVSMDSPGSLVRRNGRLVAQKLGAGRIKVRFANGQVSKVTPIPWGDLATAPRSTNIPNVVVFMDLPQVPGMERIAPVAFKMLAIDPLRHIVQNLVNRVVVGPDEDTRRTARTNLWARVTNDQGRSVQAWLETSEPYQLTAVAGVRAIEKTLEQNPSGALTPSQAFGANFIMELEGTKRYDSVR